MKFKDHKDFFDLTGNVVINDFSCWENDCFVTKEITIEEMYQHFKTRMFEESTQKQDGMVLVNADVVRHAIHNISAQIDIGLNDQRTIYEALNIIEDQLNGK